MLREQSILINLVKKDTFGKKQFSNTQTLLQVTMMFSDFTKTVLEGTLFYDATKHTGIFIFVLNNWHSIVEKSLFALPA